MSTHNTDNSRRDFLKISSLAGGGLLLGLSLSGCSKPGALGTEGGQPVAWLKIDGENGITVLVDRSEMGQGVYTSLTQLLAEELEVSLDAIKVVAAPVNAVYVNALLGAQITGGTGRHLCAGAHKGADDYPAYALRARFAATAQ